MEIAAGRFKALCLGLMDHVRDTHERVIITKHGTPVAQLVPVEGTPPTPLAGALRGSVHYDRRLLEE